jgi:transcriptional regulator with XRE-family HTH domain
MTFGQKLRRLREELGLSQDALGERAGIHGRHIGRFEIGGAMPRAETVVALARALGTSIDSLLRDDEPGASAGGPSPARDPELMRRLRQVERLPETDRRAIYAVIDAFVAKRRRRGRPGGGGR